MWFAFSLFTIMAWGTGNLFQKMGTNPKDKTSHWKIVITIGFAMGIHAVSYMIYKDYGFDFFNIVRYLPVSFLYISSMTFSYVGLRYIELSIVSPICNSSGAVTAILCFFILGQPMSSLQLLGVIFVCVGIFLLSYFEKKQSDQKRALADKLVDQKYIYGFAALIFPLLYCVLDGIGSFADALYLQNYMSEQDALLSYEFTFLIAAILALIYVKCIKKATFHLNEERWKVAAALCETAGQFTYIFAMADNAVVAAPMIASYCVISVILSRIILKERLSRKQYLSIVIVMLGIAVLGIE